MGHGSMTGVMGGRVVYDVTISYIMIMGGGRVGERAQGESLGTRVFKN